MSWTSDLVKRLRALLGKTNEAQLDEELRFHVEMETEENVRRGMPAADARNAALRRLGSIAATKESYRDARAFTWLADLSRDLRYATRSLSKSPGFLLFAALSLALGIGANTAIFSFFDTVVLRTLPIPDPQNLRVLTVRSSEGPAVTFSASFSHPQFREFRDAAAPIADVFAAASSQRMEIRFLAPGESAAAAAPEPVRLQEVSGNYFPAVQVAAAAGRLLNQDDDLRPNAHPVAVISHRFWTSRFRRDPAAVGTEFVINGNAFTIVGVAEAGFDGLSVGDLPDLWLPVAMETAVDPGSSTLESRRHSWLRLMARLHSGQPESALHAVLAAQLTRSTEEHAKSIENPEIRQAILRQRIHIESGARGFGDLRSEMQQPLLILFGLALLVFATGCANVANLLLARSAARQREIAVRLSIGASRLRIARQLLAESAVLCAAGVSAGLLVAYGVTAWLAQVVERTAAATVPIAFDWRLLLFVAAIAVASILLVGLAPAWSPTRNAASLSLGESARTVTATRGHVRLRKTLVFLQVAASVVLLVGASLMVRSLYNLLTMDAGFHRENVLTVSVSPRYSGYEIPRSDTAPKDEVAQAESRLMQLYQRMEDAVRSVPGVRSAGFADCGFLTGCNGNRCCMVIPGVELNGLEEKSIRTDLATPGFFDSSGLRVLQGRAFTDADHAKAPQVAVINQTAARELFRGEDPIGREIRWMRSEQPPLRIVGVVADAKHTDLREKTPRFLFQPFAQAPFDSAVLYVRTATPAPGYAEQIRAALLQVEPGLRVGRIQSQQQLVDRSVVRERIVSELCASFTLLALLLAAIGLYGVMAFQVIRRTNEFGIRMALGARQPQILWNVLRETLALGAAGILVGLAAALMAARLLESMLYGIAAWDLWSFLLASATVAIVAIMAGYLPARRAAAVDPAVALRYE